MSAPLTGYEQHGGYTTLTQELALLTQIANETDAHLSVAGETVQGKPIYRLDVGAGPNTMLIIGLQHAGEPAGREAALMLVRDLAYSTDPEVQGYLASHRVVLLPTMNADMVFSGRDNSVGVNLNRDWYKLEQPETRAVMAAIRDTQPQVILDLHESGLDAEQWLGSTEMIAGAAESLAPLGADLLNVATAAVVANGHTANVYPRDMTPVSGASVAAGAFHAVGLLSEPLLYARPAWSLAPLPDRVAVSDSIIRAAQQWHHAHSAALAEARSASITYATTTTDPIPLVLTEMVNGPRVTVDAAGYRLREPLPAHVVDLHGIEVQGSYVSLNQPARLAVAMLCDPQSRDRIVEATQVARPLPPMPFPAGEWTETFVVVEGITHRVVDAWHVVNGQRMYLRLPSQ